MGVIACNRLKNKRIYNAALPYSGIYQDDRLRQTRADP